MYHVDTILKRQKLQKKKKKVSRIALYGLLEVQNHQVSNINRSSHQFPFSIEN